MRLKIIGLLITALISLNGCKDFSPVDVGNGGHGVVRGDKVYLLDLVEIGQEESGISKQADISTAKAKFFINLLSETLPNDFPVEALYRKITEIEAVDPIVSTSLLWGIQQFRWSVVDRRLKPIPLDEHPGYDVRVIARRNHTWTISLEKFCWDRMDETSKVALIFHEIIYSFLPTERIDPSYGIFRGAEYSRQNAKRAREIVQMFFKPALPAPGSLATLLKRDELPHTYPIGPVAATVSVDKWKNRVTYGARVGEATLLVVLDSKTKASVNFYPDEPLDAQAIRQICEGRMKRKIENTFRDYFPWNYAGETSVE